MIKQTNSKKINNNPIEDPLRIYWLSKDYLVGIVTKLLHGAPLAQVLQAPQGLNPALIKYNNKIE